jgi:hypothetical protein
MTTWRSAVSITFIAAFLALASAVSAGSTCPRASKQAARNASNVTAPTTGLCCCTCCVTGVLLVALAPAAAPERLLRCAQSTRNGPLATPASRHPTHRPQAPHHRIRRRRPAASAKQPVHVVSAVRLKGLQALPPQQAVAAVLQGMAGFCPPQTLHAQHACAPTLPCWPTASVPCPAWAGAGDARATRGVGAAPGRAPPR